MNKNLKKLHIRIQSKIDLFTFNNIIGDTVGIGLNKFFQLKNDLSGVEEIDYSEILLESLDNKILDNKIFVKLLIKNFLTEEEVDLSVKKFNIDNNLSYYKKRNILLTKKNKPFLMSLFKIDKSFLKNNSSDDTVTREIIEPFTPVPIKEKNSLELIPSEYLSLHEYQKRIKDKFIKEIVFNSSAKALIHMPTGSGKTKTTVEGIIDFVKVKLTYPHDKGSILWFAHSKELCEQAYDTFKTLWKFKGDHPINLYKVFGDSDYKEVFKCKNDHVSIIFIGFQKFDKVINADSSDTKFHSLKQHLIEFSKLVIIDEAHKALAKTYKNALDFVTQTKGCRLVGLTATPGRSNYIKGSNDNKELAEFFGSKIIKITNQNDTQISNPLKYLQDKEVLAKVEMEELPITIDFTKENYSLKEYDKVSKLEEISIRELNIIATDPHRNSIIIDKIKENINGTILVFACSKDHCLLLKKILKIEYNIDSVVILGDTNPNVRSKAIADFKNKKLKVLINYGVLSTGFDAPKLNTLIVARPTKSIVLYSQIVGRALRGPANGGNKKNKIITLKDNLLGFSEPDFMFSYWESFWN